MEKRAHKRTLKGKVVSVAMAKTVVVQIDRTKIHPIYHKRYQTSRRYKAHDPEKKFQVGDYVVMEETRPISKDKRWRVLKKVNEEKS
ncbi:MAG: 30S ribosomal protein S17 [Patescibacteria group bacterium]|jgi:small subunit ribosomal protein S17